MALVSDLVSGQALAVASHIEVGTYLAYRNVSWAFGRRVGPERSVEFGRGLPFELAEVEALQVQHRPFVASSLYEES